jgi:hypothetical protein
MNWYLITYDLRKKRDYKSLYEALARFKAVSLLESVWLAELRGPAATVRDLLKAEMDGDDGMVSH